MGEDSRSVKCGDCGEALSPDAIEPCPKCGSSKRHFALVLDDTLDMHDSVSGKVTDPYPRTGAGVRAGQTRRRFRPRLRRLRAGRLGAPQADGFVIVR